MNVMIKKYIQLMLAGALTLGAISCDDEFLDRHPLDQVSDVSFWKTEEQLKVAVNACYAHVKAKNTVDMENLGDNTIWPSVTDYQRIGTGNFGDDIAGVNSEWTNQYDGIRRCNHFLENYQHATINEDLRNRYAAEVRFIRAYLYSYLTFFFGDVQFITKTLSVDDPMVYGTRESKKIVVDWMLQELEEAATYLPATYAAADIGRITKGAALALKARVALYNGEYAIAEKAAKAVMDLGVHSLYNTGNPATTYWELFSYKGRASRNNLNKESILIRPHLLDFSVHNLSREIQVPDQAIRWNPTRSLADAYLCKDGLPIDKSPLYAGKPQNYNDIFANRDPRMTQTILAPGSPWKGLDDGDANNTPNDIYNLPKFKSDKKGAVTITGYYFTKYCEPSTVGLVSKDENDIILIRYAEVLLTYAEALLEQGRLTQAEVDATINLLRRRVGMPDMVIANLQAAGLDLREELRRERRVELALEGHRYFDIIRWGKGDILAQDVLGMKRSFAPNQADVSNLSVNAEGYILVNTGRTFTSPKNYLWPVPFVQRERNPNLGRNPGW